jgi:urease accessory protein
MGFVIATGCLHACGIGVGTLHRWVAGARVLRGFGALIAAGGAFFMWRAIT